MKRKTAKMNRKTPLTVICFFALLCMMVTVNAKQQPVDGIAAVVGDSTILRSEVDAFAYMLANQAGQQPDSLTINMLRQKALEELINGKVLLVKAEKDTNINISDSDVEKEVDSRIGMILKQNGIDMETFGQMLRKQQNLSVQEFRDELRRQIKHELVSQHVQQLYVSSTMTKSDVTNFYEEYKDSLPSAGKSVLLSKIHVTVSPSQSVREQAYKKINNIRKKLENGADFGDMARKYSEGPDAENGGVLGFIAKGTLSQIAFEKQIFSLDVGQTSEPFETRLGWHIVKILSKKDQQVEVQQIFIAIEAPEETVQRKKAILDSISENATSSEEFVEAVKKFSTDKVSRSRNGKIGWKSVDALPPQLKKSVSDLDVGDISAPIREDKGWSIYRLEERVDNRPLSLEEDWNEISQIARRVITQKKLRDLVEEWRQELYIDVRM